ncbi:dockerin type I repeat-containing protein [bacterium]|nr:dockerin type I repeat-containing protein [bacterium]
MTKLRSFLLVTIIISLICSTSQIVIADDEKPVWTVGSWWDYSTEMILHIQETGSAEYLDLTFNDENTRHILESIGQKTLSHGAQMSYNAYVLSLSGIVNAEGIYHVTDPFPQDIPIEIRDATLTGEWWVDTATNGTIYYTRTISGPIWAEVFTWQEIGTVNIVTHEEYETGRLLVDFPVETGNTWIQDITFYSFGNYVVDGELMGEPIHEEDTFDEEQDNQLDMVVTSEEISHGFMTYRIDGSETGSTGTIQTNYGPDPQNVVFDELLNFGSSGSTQINSMEKSLDDYYLEPAGPTPTPGDCINNGDVTLDGEVTAADAQMAFMIALGSHIPSIEEECAADCNGDGEVTAGDAQQVFMVALGSLPACADPLLN